jgi:hypothetical protein
VANNWLISVHKCAKSWIKNYFCLHQLFHIEECFVPNSAEWDYTIFITDNKNTFILPLNSRYAINQNWTATHQILNDTIWINWEWHFLWFHHMMHSVTLRKIRVIQITYKTHINVICQKTCTCFKEYSLNEATSNMASILAPWTLNRLIQPLCEWPWTFIIKHIIYVIVAILP